ncbi:hypothetical protein NDU88_005220 [Pleurodeles waltl]|uniref:Uncharacterized protein n=1 Tax=Pleurodeles waltl TaxID=8319 RepID=A0AAV7L248_PLEWA|nr:hypothetical protein NDU88_005220 [Pleurodeles waltl]
MKRGSRAVADGMVQERSELNTKLGCEDKKKKEILCCVQSCWHAATLLRAEHFLRAAGCLVLSVPEIGETIGKLRGRRT